MQNTKKVIIFRHEDGTEAFQIKDGGTIIIDGVERSVTYVNEDYFLVDIKCYSHRSFYEEMIEKRGATVTYGRGVIKIAGADH